MISEAERIKIKEVRQYDDKFILKQLQRIYLRENPNEQECCLCTVPERTIWKNAFYEWFDSLEQK